MSNQNFKMILTGPISSMGDVVNCVTGHGGKIEMVEVEDAKTVAVEKHDEPKRTRVLTTAQVYKALMNPDITNKTPQSIAQYLTATTGTQIKPSSVSSHLSKLKASGSVVTTGRLGKSGIWAVANSGLSPDEAARKANIMSNPSSYKSLRKMIEG